MQTENITALELFETGLRKSDLKVMAGNAVDSVLEKGNVLQVAEALSAMELFVKEVKDDSRFKELVRDEACKTPKGFVSNSGAKIELVETGTSYDFSKCNDSELLSLEASLSKVKENLEKRKSFLKTVPLSGLDIITEDGEAIKIYPPSKTSTSSYKITLAK